MRHRCPGPFIKNRLQAIRDRGHQAVRASFTIECALILPLFFSFCVTLIQFMNALSLKTTESFRLMEKARQLSIAGECIDEVRDTADEVKWVDLRTTKTFRFPLVPGIPALHIALRARTAVWTGGGISPLASSSEEEMVYVSDTESVYHTSSDCSHLDLSVFQCGLSEVGQLRNIYGRRYRPCRGFPRNHTGPVYTTAKGDYYYPSPNYGSLTRHMRLVSRSECESLRQCSRCRSKTGPEREGETN